MARRRGPVESRRGSRGSDIAPLSLVLDWDGTITEHDSLIMVLEQFGDWEECRRLGDQLFRGEITLHEEIDRQFATVTAPLDEVVAWVVENVRVRPGLPRAGRAVSPAGRLQRPPRADRAGARARGGRGRAAGEPGLDPGRTAGASSGGTKVVCAVCGQPCKRGTLPVSTASSSTSATAIRTAAPRSPPTGLRPPTAWPTTSTSAARVRAVRTTCRRRLRRPAQVTQLLQDRPIVSGPPTLPPPQ